METNEVRCPTRYRERLTSLFRIRSMNSNFTPRSHELQISTRKRSLPVEHQPTIPRTFGEGTTEYEILQDKVSYILPGT